jgi:hypothetical protein
MSTNIDSSPIAGCYKQTTNTSLFEYFSTLLTAIGAPLSYENFVGLTAWALCEGPPSSQGAYNPLNTTLKTINVLPGNAGDLGNNPKQNNGEPVKNYNGFSNGVAATVESMGAGIKGALKAGNSPGAIAAAQAAQHWGTNPACIVSKIAQYQSNPTTLCHDIGLTVAGKDANGLPEDVSQGDINNTPGANNQDPGAAVPGLNISGSSLFGPLGTLLGDITSGKFWLRVGQLVLGGLLILAGLFFILSETKEGKAVESSAATAAIAA